MNVAELFLTQDAIAEFIHESDIQMRQCKKYIKTKNPRATE